MVHKDFPKVTVAMMASCFAVFLLQIVFQDLTAEISLTPIYAFAGSYWQFFTYMFAHGSITHLGLNMLALFIFGSVTERVLGWKKYLTLYVLCGLGSAAMHIALTGISDVPLLGASGSVFGVLTAYAFMFPKNIVIVFPGIPVPAALLVAFFAIFELFSGFFGLEPGIANFGHLGGIVAGLAIMSYWKWADRSKRPSWEDYEYTWDSGIGGM
ncbi:MAG: rhomboid family intramembrane serine protease, partial [Candidatus Aenigmatarchaeota archaeon]